MKASRLFFYTQMACAGLLPALGPFGGRRRASGSAAILALATTVVALHNFPVMPWQTTDGIFFCVLGLVAWAESCSPQAWRPLLWRAAAWPCWRSAWRANRATSSSVSGSRASVPTRSRGRSGRAASRARARSRPCFRLAASVGPAVAVLGLLFLWLWGTGAWPHFIAEFQSQESSTGALWAHIIGPYKPNEYRSRR